MVKIWMRVIKETSKSYDWKFKGRFAYKVINEFFYICRFMKNEGDVLFAYIGFKPLIVDDIFRKILSGSDDIKTRLSLRGDGIYSISPLIIWSCNVPIADVSNPNQEIEKLLKDVDDKIRLSTTEVNNIDKFLEGLFIKENRNTIAIVTLLIAKENYSAALEKIEVYKENSMDSRYFVEGRDYYDLAKEYCIKAMTK